MKNNLISLLKADLVNRFRLNSFTHEKNSRKKAGMIGVSIAFVILFLMLAGYAFALSYGFGMLGMSYVVPGYAITIASIMTLFFTFFKTNGILFGAKDYDMLMALPIPTETIITAKFLSMYFNNLGFAILIMAPMGIGYGIFCPFHVITLLGWVIGILVTPLLPMTIAAMIGTFIVGIGAGFKHKILVQAILSIALVLGVFAIIFYFQSTAQQDTEQILAMLADLGPVISAMLHRIYPLSAWFDRAVNEQKILPLLLLVAVSMVIYGIFAFVCGKYYRKINSSLKSHHATSNYQVGVLRTKTLMSALVWKEAKRFFSSIVYLMNMGIGLIMALLFSIISAFVGIDKVLGTMELGDLSMIRPILVNVIPFGIATVVNMSNTTSVSLSLEGANLWVVQSLPIPRKKLLQGKILFQIMLALPVSLLCNLLFVIQLHVSLPMALSYLLFSITSVLLSAVWGSFVNVHFPNFSWENEVQVIKQGMSSTVGIFSSMIVYIIMAVGAAFLGSIVPGELVVVGFSVLTGLMALIVYRRKEIQQPHW